MASDTLDLLLDELHAWLAINSRRTRAVVLTGPPGIGASTMLEQLHARSLDIEGVTLVVHDDVDLLDPTTLASLVEHARNATNVRLLLAGRSLPATLVNLLDRSCDRRVVEIPPMDESSARALIGSLGVPPWSVRARKVLDQADGIPRNIVDGIWQLSAPAQWELVDRSFDHSSTGPMIAGWYQALHRLDHEARAQIIVDASSLLAHEPDDVSVDVILDATIVLAEEALINDRFDDARALLVETVSLSGSMQLTLLAATMRHAIDAVAGEPTALLSLHAVAGRASRAQLPVCEAFAWLRVFNAAFYRGDVQLASRAAERLVRVCDDAELLTLGLIARSRIAQAHLVAGTPGQAEGYLEEILELASQHNLHYLECDAASLYARTLVARGALDEARAVSEQSLANIVDQVHGGMAIDARITAARIRALTGDCPGAVVMLGDPNELAACHDNAGQGFWLGLEAVRVLVRSACSEDQVDLESAREQLAPWVASLQTWTSDLHGGALNAAHAEVEAWLLLLEGNRASASRKARTVRQMWINSECHEEVDLCAELIRADEEEVHRQTPLTASASPDQSSSFEVLTRREREIAQYVAGGLTNPEIAAELVLSPRTVEHHVASILRKLELPSRRALIRGRN